MSDQDINWTDIGKKLAAPFDPEEVEWRVQGTPTPNKRMQLVAYIDARCGQDRLDAVVGVGAWSFDWQPLNFSPKNELTSAKGTLTIHSLSKSDIGVASNFAADKGCVSDALKRAAVHWGIARYLYALDQVWVTLDDKGHIAKATLDNLRAGLRRKASRTSAPVAQQTETESDETYTEPAPREHQPVAAPQPVQRTAPAQRAPQPNPSASHESHESSASSDGDSDSTEKRGPAPTKAQLESIANLSLKLHRQPPTEIRNYGHAKAIMAKLVEEVNEQLAQEREQRQAKTRAS